MKFLYLFSYELSQLFSCCNRIKIQMQMPNSFSINAIKDMSNVFERQFAAIKVKI